MFARFFVLSIAVFAASMLHDTESASAGFVFTAEQSGPNVVITGTGSMNTVSLGTSSFGPSTSFNLWRVFSQGMNVGTGGTNATTTIRRYTGVTAAGPTTISSATTTLNADTSSGSMFMVFDPALFGGSLNLPLGYVSGSPVSTEATFNNKTLADFGWTAPTNLLWTLNNGETISISAVPEPTTYAMVLAGAACGAFSMWRRRREAGPSRVRPYSGRNRHGPHRPETVDTCRACCMSDGLESPAAGWQVRTTPTVDRFDNMMEKLSMKSSRVTQTPFGRRVVSRGRVRRNALAGMLACLIATGFAEISCAGVIVTPRESQDGWLQFAWSGSLDLTGATVSGSVGGTALFVSPQAGALGLANTSSTNFQWAATGAGAYGTGSSAQPGGATSSGNSSFVMRSSAIQLVSTYTSGASLTGTTTFTGVTYAAAGLIPGNYTWTLNGSGDTVVMQVPVPEPATYGMAIAGVACGGFSMWRRRMRA